MRQTTLLPALVAVLACATMPAGAADAVIAYKPSAYAEYAKTRGVVLVSVNWGRRWKCGRFENAQLERLAFDRSTSAKDGEDASAELVLEDRSIPPAAESFVNYAYIVTPGTYLLSGYSVRAARSVSEVGHFKAGRAELIKDGRSTAGSFNLSAGEIVYIGHFFLDCARDPIPWRYYPSDRADFARYLGGVGKQFDALDVGKAAFRLFETTTMGEAFVLR